MPKQKPLPEATNDTARKLGSLIDELEWLGRRRVDDPAKLDRVAETIATVNAETDRLILAWLRRLDRTTADQRLAQVLAGRMTFKDFQGKKHVRELIRLRSALRSALLEYWTGGYKRLMGAPGVTIAVPVTTRAGGAS